MPHRSAPPPAPPRRTVRSAQAAALALLALGSIPVEARAQSTEAVFPARPVRLIAASAPGGGIDLIGRIVAQRLSEAWKQQVVVDNRAGSGGLIATELVVRAVPDGHTLLMQSVGVAYVGTLNRNAPFDVLRDLAPVSLVASQPSLILAHAGLPVQSLADLLALARAKPGQVSYGSGGAGGASHMGTELFAQAAGIRLLHIPYKGTGPSMAAVLSGEVNLAMVGVTTSLPHLRTGKVRALAVTSAQRSPHAPDVPTAAEAGVSGYEFAGWYGLFAPAKTPAALVLRINADVNRVLASAEARQQYASGGLEPLGGGVEAFRAYFAREVAKWRTVIEKGGISTQ
ncbi:MAG: tripartite tricarboxylate transporter substrate binding protein [Pseudomonadota bacterium]|jgi:tripartite-type tricarboxylate transporter receptor subunit TctC